MILRHFACLERNQVASTSGADAGAKNNQLD
jgi:hypothetical protein